MPTKKAPKKTTSKKTTLKNLGFEFYAPQATAVTVAGTFNDWDSNGLQLKSTKDGHWSGRVSVEPGRYEYRFLIDGNWENDQKGVELVPNEYGSLNCTQVVG